VVAIVAQGLVAIALSFLPYERILTYVTSVDSVFFGLSALALIIFRNRDARDPSAPRPIFHMPGHPVTTLLFLAISWGIVADVAITSPKDASIGLGILLLGLPVYALFARRTASARARTLQAAHQPRQ
jgi:APA family basic amino acid/polyamine antiporter